MENNNSKLWAEIKEIKDNHLHHIHTQLIANTTDLLWLKKAYWVVATASIGALIAALVNLL